MSSVLVTTRVTCRIGGLTFAADIDAEGQVTAGYVRGDRGIDAADLPAAFFQAIADAVAGLERGT